MKKYSINCRYYTSSFDTLDELIQDVLNVGQDPNYNVTEYGKKTSTILIDLICP